MKEKQDKVEKEDEVIEFEAGKAHPETPASVEIPEDRQPVSRKRVRVVTESKTPTLSVDFIKAAGKKTFTVEALFDTEERSFEVLRSVPLKVALLLQKTSEIYALKRNVEGDDKTPDEKEEADIEQIEKTERDFKRNVVAEMVVETDEKTGQIRHIFSYNGAGGDIQIEDQSDKFLLTLYDGVMEVLVPEGSAAALNRFQRVGE